MCHYDVFIEASFNIVFQQSAAHFTGHLLEHPLPHGPSSIYSLRNSLFLETGGETMAPGARLEGGLLDEWGSSPPDLDVSMT